ncbi:uncharacterized protein LOC143210566 [Lasioglossum baleicum]|uniref:uncharacterized protein LOC143210565 n=1 Tax=Lasioglossum baleicum TaxID=434251 RepID=UPI003FCE9FE8
MDRKASTNQLHEKDCSVPRPEQPLTPGSASMDFEASPSSSCLHPKYVDSKFKAIIWREIADELGLPANSSEECKRRWQNIRSCYRKHRGRTQTRSGQAAGTVKPHKFGNTLDFLDPCFQERRMKSSAEECSQEASTDDNSSAPTPKTDTVFEETDEDVECQPPPKRSRIEETKQAGLIDCISRCTGLIERTVSSGETENSVRARMLLFFKSMALEVCQFDVRRQNIVKSALLAKVSELQEEIYNETLANNANTPSSDETGV